MSTKTESPASVSSAVNLNPLAAALGAAFDSLMRTGVYDRLYERWFRASPGSSIHPYPPSESWAIPGSGEPEIARVLSSGCLRVGFGVLGPPFSFERSGEGEGESGNKVVGGDLDLAREWTASLGALYGVDLRHVPVRLPPVPFPDRLLDELGAGVVDMVLSDLAVTEARRLRVDFSPPYLCATFGLLCADEERSRRLCSVAASNNPQTRLVVLRRAFLNELADRELPDAQRIWVDDPKDILPALQAGRGDAALLPYASIRAFQEEWPEAACPEFCVGPGALRAAAVSKKPWRPES